MENILKTIENINNINYFFDLALSDDALNLMATQVENNVYKDFVHIENIKNLCEYVDNIASRITDEKNIYNYDVIRENTNKFEEIYKNAESFVSKDIHSENISNSADYSNFTPNFVDNSENSGENNWFSHENNEFFHNNSNFKEIYGFVDNISAPEIKNNSQTSNNSSININLGGVTQNITEANCDKVIEELSDMLLRALSGCDGIY